MRRVATTWNTMPIQVNWNSSVMATDTGSMVSAKLYSTQVVHVARPSPSKDSTRLGDSGTGRLPRTVSAAKATANSSAPKNAWLAAVWVHDNPSASLHLIVAAITP